MQTFNVYTVQTTSRAGIQTALKMYSKSEEVQAFYDALSNNQSVVEFKVVFSRPREVYHFNNYIGSA